MQDADPLPSRRGRRGLIALLILLLILLPLYLWPLRGGLGGLPGASALLGAVRDPRSAAAVAEIPGDVWDALMGHTHAPPPPTTSAKPPRNLTMIASADGLPGSGLDQGPSGPFLSDGPASLARGMLAQLGSSDVSDTGPGIGEVPSPPVEFASTPWSGTGIASAFGPGGYPGQGGSLGPWRGGGSVVSGLVPTVHPGDPAGDPVDLAPTPEPGTLLLVGSNLTLLGAAAWKRRLRRLGIPPIG